MSLKTLLSKIGNFFKNLFESANYQIKRLSPELLKAFEIGSGIVAFINQNLDEDSDTLVKILKEKFGVTDEQILHFLKQAGFALNIGKEITDVKDIGGLVAIFQEHLSELKINDGSLWAKVSSLIAKVIAQVSAPEGTKSSVFELLMEAFYHLYVKK